MLVTQPELTLGNRMKYVKADGSFRNDLRKSHHNHKKMGRELILKTNEADSISPVEQLL